MKKTIITISAITFLAFGCQKTKEHAVSPTQINPQETSKSSLSQRVTSHPILTSSSIGEIHNLYLANFINEVRSEIENKGFSQFKTNDLKNIFQQEVLNDIHGTEGANAELRAFAKHQFESQLVNIRYDLNAYNKNIVINATHVSSTFKTIAINLIDDANAIGAEKNIEFLKNKYLKLLEENGKNLTEIESGIILAGISTMENSFSYWATDDVIWVNTLGEPQNVYAGGGLGDGIGGADVGGCVGGGVFGALVGGTVTLGIGAAPGWLVGAIGGGVSASIGKGAENLWNHWF
jgi:hypothetical protein